MKFKGLAVVLSCIYCFSLPMQTNAAETDQAVVTAASSEEVMPLAAGLISSHSLICAAGTKTVYITATTTGSEEMSKIGFIDITIQRSSDLTNWTTEKTLSDKIKENATTYSLDKYAVSVQGGYYYRVTLTHYAKEQTWFFPDEQSVTSTSAYLWVPNS